MVDLFKQYEPKSGAVLINNPSAGNIKRGILDITLESIAAIVKYGTTRVEDCRESAGTRLLAHLRRVSSGEIHARAEENEHLGLKFSAEQTVSL